MPYPSVVGAAALWFGLVGPSVPFPALAVLVFARTGIFDRELFLQGFALYPMALLVGGFAALAVGLVYGFALVLTDRFRPRLLHATRATTRIAKSILFPLTFTALLGSAGSLIQLLGLVLLTRPVYPGLRPTAGFQILGDPAAFAAPTLLCGILFTYWALPRLPGQIRLLARGTDGEVRKP